MTVTRLPTIGLAHHWASRLARAHTEAQLIAVVRDFVAGITPDELGRLPEDFRPRRFVDGQDVSEFALLVRLHELLPHAGPPEPGLQTRIAIFFASASQRLAQISPTLDQEEGKSA